MEFNQETYNYFQPLITPEAAIALQNLKRIIKDEGQSIISALLCLYFSAITVDELQTLSGMQRVLDDPELIRVGLQQSPYYEEAEWQCYLNSRDDLRTIFRFLESIHYPDTWQQTVLPQLEAEIQTIIAYLAEYDVVAQMESLIGYTLPSPTITVYVLNYTRPHGIKVIGQRFITGTSWPPKIALRTAVHEMLHPPYDLNNDPVLKTAIEELQQDPFIAEKFSNHNPDFGYNSFIGYVEENCVRALDQVVNETFNIARNPQERWRDEDGGGSIALSYT
ncbi:MAG TPA: hypothetical protein VHL11_07085, partial [Phototrophicaceae bacterium]|nr:hypothetical protein [Phototrophicaceae bacterium]